MAFFLLVNASLVASAILTWDETNSVPPAAYNVYGAKPPDCWQWLATTTNLFWEHITTESWAYFVTALNAAGESAPSNVACLPSLDLQVVTGLAVSNGVFRGAIQLPAGVGPVWLETTTNLHEAWQPYAGRGWLGFEAEVTDEPSRFFRVGRRQ